MQLQTSQTLQKEAAWKDDKTKTFDSVSQTITRSTEGYNFSPVSKKEGWGDKASVSALPTLLQFPLGPSGSCIWALGSSCLTWICSETGREHPELFLQLERWHSLLRLGAPLLPWRVWVFNPQPLQAQRKLPAGFQHCRVSSYSFYDSFSYSFVLFFLWRMRAQLAWNLHTNRMISWFHVSGFVSEAGSLSAGSWQAAPLCWTPTTWWGWVSPTGSAFTRTSKSSTAAWWRKAWSKQKSDSRDLSLISHSILSVQKREPWPRSNARHLFEHWQFFKAENAMKSIQQTLECWQYLMGVYVVSVDIWPQGSVHSTEITHL